MSLRFIKAAVIVAVFVSGSLPSKAQDCEWLMKYGIYDIDTKVESRYHYAYMQSLVRASASYKDLKDKADSFNVGAAVEGLGGITFGNNKAEKNWKEWQEAFTSASISELESRADVKTQVMKISSALMDVVKECIRNKHKHPFVIGSISPGADVNAFTLKLTFVPTNAGAKCKVESIVFVSSIRGQFDPLKPEFKEKLLGTKKKPAKEPVDIDEGGQTILFTRSRLSEAISVVVNTTQGTVALNIPAGKEPEPKEAKSDAQKVLEGEYEYVGEPKRAKAHVYQTDRFVILQCDRGTTFGYLVGKKIESIQAINGWDAKDGTFDSVTKTIDFSNGTKWKKVDDTVKEK